MPENTNRSNRPASAPQAHRPPAAEWQDAKSVQSGVRAGVHGMAVPRSDTSGTVCGRAIRRAGPALRAAAGALAVGGSTPSRCAASPATPTSPDPIREREVRAAPNPGMHGDCCASTHPSSAATSSACSGPARPRRAPLVHLAVVVREVANEPVPEHAGGDARAHAPEHESPPAPHIEQHGPRQLLRHPGALEESIEAVVGDTRLEHQARLARAGAARRRAATRHRARNCGRGAGSRGIPGRRCA